MNGSALALIVVAQLAVLATGVRFLRTAKIAEWGMFQAAGALAAILVLSVFIFVVSEPPYVFSDFRKAYYPAGVAVLESADALSPLIERVFFVNLPSVAYFFAPLGLLPFKWAAVVFFAAGIAATLLAWRLLAQQAQLTHAGMLVLLLLFAANGPLLNSLREGNTSHYVLLLLAVALGFLRDGRHLQAGVALGLCALIKLPLLIFGPYLLLRRNWYATAAFSGVLATAGVISLAAFGWDQNVRWFELCVLQFSRNPIGAFNVQSFPGFFLRLEGGETLLRDWSAHPIEPAQRYLATAIVLALMSLAIAVGARRTNPAADDERQVLEFCVVTTLAVIASPMSWTHYYCWLLVPAAFLLNPSSVIASTPVTRGLAWAAIFLTTPIVLMAIFENSLASQLYAKALVSHYLLGGLIWFGILVWALATLSRKPASQQLAAAAS